MQMSQLNISLYIMIMMLLDHYVKGLMKWLDMLKALIVTDKNLLKSILKYGEKSAI